MNHKEFLASAELLAGGKGEIDFRNAASRGYYSAYHACGTVVEHCPPVVGVDCGMHEKLILRFKKYPAEGKGHAVAVKIAWLMDQMRPTRVRADYRLDIDFNKKNAETLIAQAKRMSEFIDEFAKLHIGP